MVVPIHTIFRVDGRYAGDLVKANAMLVESFLNVKRSLGAEIHEVQLQLPSRDLRSSAAGELSSSIHRGCCCCWVVAVALTVGDLSGVYWGLASCMASETPALIQDCPRVVAVEEW